MIGRSCGIPVFLLGITALPAEERPDRLSVAVLWFEDGAASGSSETRHWSYWAGLQVASDLAVVKRLRVLSRDRIQCAFKKLGVKPAGPIAAPIAQALGEALEARRVVWGSWRREGGAWQLQARPLNVGTGELGTEFHVTGKDINAASLELSFELLRSWNIGPSPEERSRMSRAPTGSEIALESLSRLYAASLEKEPYAVQETLARRVLQADPACVEAQVALGAILGTQGNLPEAETAVREALTLDPRFAPAHCVLGTLFLVQGKTSEGGLELTEAERLEPDYVETLVRFSELYALRKDWAQAILYLERAVRIDPMNSALHAKIGKFLADQGKRDKALSFLKEAERLHCGEANTDQMLFLGYYLLGETRLAIERFEALAAWSSRQGVNPPLLDEMRRAVEQLKARLTPVPVITSRPRVFTAQELEAELQKLSQDERNLIPVPLASGEGLRARAREITRDARDDLTKARALFEALSKRGGAGGTRRVRTALEAFAAWDDSNETFVCQDFAKLYVAMAREVGLDAFYVNVDKDPAGKTVAHVCAAVFLDGKVLLPDVTYGWFGAPHKEFQVLDDLQAAALELTQLSCSPDALRCRRLAVKLWSGSAITWLSLAIKLAEAEAPAEVRSALDEARRLGSDHWQVYMLEAWLAGNDGNLDKAELYLRAATLMNPEDAQCHYELGKILQIARKLAEAREEFRAALRCRPDPVIEAKARRHLAEVEEGLGGDREAVPAKP